MRSAMVLLAGLLLVGCRSGLPGVLPSGWAERPVLGERAIRLESDLEAAQAREALSLLEQTHAEFARRFDNTGFADAPLRVLIFRDAEDYGRYTGDRYAGGVREGDVVLQGMGQFHSHRRLGQVIKREIAIVAGSELEQLVFGSLEFESTLRHEMAHAFVDLLHHRMPYALDEGIAVFLSAPDGKPNDTARLPQEGDELTPLRQLLAMDRRGFLSAPLRSYSQAYALVAYLVHVDRRGSLADLHDLAFKARLVAGERDPAHVAGSVRAYFGETK